MRRSHILILSLAALAVFIPLQVWGQTSRLYLAGYMGVNLYGDMDFKETETPAIGTFNANNAPSFAGAIGLRLSRDVRVEAELSYRKMTSDKLTYNGTTADAPGELKQWLGLINLYYDFNVPWKVEPFVNVGLGMGHFNGDLTAPGGGPTFSGDTNAIVWNAGAGLKYRVKPNMAFTGGYRYLDSTDLDFDSFNIDYSSHEFRIGIEYDLK